MGMYITGTQLMESVTQLNLSRSNHGFADFLVLKRAQHLSGDNPVVMSMKSSSFQQAINDVTNTNEVNSPSSFVKVFGMARAGQNPYLTSKYPSNGAADTIGRWHDVVEIIQQGPRVVNLRPTYLAGVKKRFVVKGKGALPTLFHTAVWCYRNTDLESLGLTWAQSIQEAKEALVASFTKDYGLIDEEIAILFDITPKLDLADDDWRTSQPASPTSYLPSVPKSEGAGEVGEIPDSKPAIISPPKPTTYVYGNGDVRCPFLLTIAAAAKPFVILTGPSGTGKSRGVFQLSRALETDVNAAHLAFVPVGADWTDMRNLLGYKNPFGPSRTRPSGEQTNDTYEITPTLRLLLRAAHPNRALEPHFLLLDEMNLSHVERYFSTFLSLMEANKLTGDDPIPLLSTDDLVTVAEMLEETGIDPVAKEAAEAIINDPSSTGLFLGPNVFIFGTVNVDETTYMFSPKVLDRAHVLEIESVSPGQYLVGGGSAEQYLSRQVAMKLLQDSIQKRKTGYWENQKPLTILKSVTDELGLDSNTLDTITKTLTTALDGAYKLLSPVGFSFAYRTVNEIIAYVCSWLLALKYDAEETSSSDSSSAPEGADLATTNPTTDESTPPTVLGTEEAFPYRWPEAIDRAILQKVLPKLHGNRRLLGDCLLALAAFLAGNDKTGSPPAKYQIGDATEEAIEPKEKLTVVGTLKESQKKLYRMHRQLEATGYTTFVE